MKFCQTHWDRLKAEIKARGLDDLVAKSGAEAAQRLAADGKGDPLMYAHNAYVANALERLGLDLMMSNPDGSEKCPVCALGAHCPDCLALAEGWLLRAADDAKTAFAKEETVQ